MPWFFFYIMSCSSSLSFMILFFSLYTLGFNSVILSLWSSCLSEFHLMALHHCGDGGQIHIFSLEYFSVIQLLYSVGTRDHLSLCSRRIFPFNSENRQLLASSCSAFSTCCAAGGEALLFSASAQPVTDDGRDTDIWLFLPSVEMS